MSARLRSVPFSPVDAAWLHMETPTNTAMITGIFTLQDPLDFTKLKQTVAERYLIYDRFRMRVKERRLGIGIPRWELDPHFSIDSHVHRIALPAPGGQEQLHDLVGDLMSTPLDFARPLWQIHLVENYGDGCAVITRLHHCIGDGLALVQFMLSVMDSDDRSSSAPPRARARPSGIMALAPVLQRIEKSIDLGEAILGRGLETIAEPGRMLDAAALGISGTRSLGKLVLTPPDKKTLFRGECGVRKRAAWTKPFSLAEVKETGKALGGTINDVLITCLAGALGRYLVGRKEDTRGLDIRAMVPVNLRKPKGEIELGNRFGLVILALPVGIRDPIERLQVLKRRMDDIKSTPEAYVAFGLLAGMGLTPAQIEKLIMRFFASKVSGVMTNVPGPREPLRFCGSRIEEIMFWVPTPGNLSFGTSIISYAGRVTVGVATDQKIAPDPEAIVQDFMLEFAAMRRRARVKPSEPSRPKVKAGQVAVQRLRSNGRERIAVQARVCSGVTRTGAPCHYQALPGSPFCARHARQLQINKPEPIAGE